LSSPDVYSPTISRPIWLSPTSPTAAMCRELFQNGAEALQEFDIFRAVLVVEMFLEIVGIDRRCRRGVAARRRQRRVVAQFPVVEIEVDGIETEAIDAALQPEAPTSSSDPELRDCAG
jgi:hypothetical protein